MTRVAHSAFIAVVKNLALARNTSRVRPTARRICRHVGSFAGRNSRRALTVFLMISLLLNATPAAAETVVGVGAEWKLSLGFWLRANDLPSKWYRTLTGQERRPPKQERQETRDAKVARIQIYPGDVTVRVEERVSLAAVAYDSQGNAIGGVRMTWRARDEGRNWSARISRQGEFEAIAPGMYKVIVEGAGKEAHIKVRVVDGTRKRKDERPRSVTPVSTRDLPVVDTSKAQPQSTQQQTASLSRSTRAKGGRAPRSERSHAGRPNFAGAGTRQPTPMTAPLPLLPDEGWGSETYPSADDPGNGRGDPPGRPLDGGAGIGNFQVAAPVLGLPGRGIDIALGLSYNSRVWNKAGTKINFDIDRDWPAPGWSLGFGKVADMGAGGGMIIDADGTRHAYSGEITNYSYGQGFNGHTTDGSLINYATWKNASGVMTWAEVNLPNGTQIHYYCSGSGGVFPTQIIDAQGNYITITYVNNAGPRIQTVTDTLGRVINFHYDGNNLLTAITTPALDVGTRTLVRLHYKQLSLDYSFPGLTPVVRDSFPWVIDAIYYPATSTGYWFGDTDSFSTFGMLAKVVQQRGMGFSASSLEEQGTVTQGQMTRKEVYNYPLFPGDPNGTPPSSPTDAPTYMSMTETWTLDGSPNNDQSATTSYLVVENASNPSQPTIPSRKVEVTLPNLTKSIQYSYNYTDLPNTDPRKALDGLVYQDETRDSSGTALQSSSVTWEKGAYDSPRPMRVEATNERNQTTATEFTYGTVYNQVVEVRNYDYGGLNLLRRTSTQYENSANYTNRRIFNLPLVTEVYSGEGTRVSRAEYEYDGESLTDTPGVVMHAENHNPYAPQYPVQYCAEFDPENHYCLSWEEYWTSDYNPVTNYRGNVTKVTTYADAVNLNGAVIETRGYDITGNVVTTSSACCEQTRFNYTTATQYAYPLSQTRGSAADPYVQVTTSAVHNFNTGLVLSATDANGRITESSYFDDTLRPQIVSLPSGAHTDYAYDDTAMTVTETSYLELHPTHTTIAHQNIKLLNGRGQVRQEKALAASGIWDVVEAEFDSMGRVSRQSRPYRPGDSLQWTSVVYDALNRATRVTAPDGSISETYHNEKDFDPADSYVPGRPDVVSQTAAGETTLVRDAWGRERWGRSDAQGRLVEVVEPDPYGSGSAAIGGFVTSYAYNTLGNLITTTQDVQTRSFKYDSLGRLLAQKLAETNATLNDAGEYQAGGGTWSDVFTYDVRSNLTSRVDARGVRTIYSYFVGGNPNTPDPLNRLQSVSWDTSGFGDDAHPILAAATINYAYRTKDTPTQLRDVTQPLSITTSDVAVESYDYDSEGRVNFKSTTPNGRPSMVTNYEYDSLDRIKDVTYPKRELLVPNSPRTVVHHNYDVASRLTSLTVDGANHASNFVYNAASQTTSLKVGALITEQYEYQAATGLLKNQTILRDNISPILNLSYDYLRPGTTTGQTGQLTKITNHLNSQRGRTYSYDAMGRLTQATGGPATGAPIWTQTYSYDRFGNRTSISASGYSAKANPGPAKPGIAKPGIAEPGSAGILPATSALSEPPAVAGGRSAENATGGSPTVREDLSSTNLNLSDSASNSPALRTQAANSHHATRKARTNAATPQGAPPVFTDDPLVPGVTIIKAVHITELRTAVNQARARASLAAANWAESVTSGLPIKADHIVELRSRLAEARSALGLPAASYTDPSLAVGVAVKAAHIQELRQRVTETVTANLAIPVDGHANLAYDLASNRITSAGFAYDKAGNQVSARAPGGGSQYFQYDAANRLVRIRANDNQTVIASYTYGDSNERLILEEAGVRTYYARNGSVEYTESGSSTTPQWSKTNIYIGARLLSTLTPNGSGGQLVQYHHPDRLGTRLVTNAQDTTYFEQVSLPFGTALTAESTGATNRRFTTYDRSVNTGLDYAINRHYDAQQGRFTQVDPIGMKAVSLESPQTLNLYAYCANDPINRTDPDGLFSWFKAFLGFLFLGPVGLLFGFQSVRRAVVRAIRVVAQVVGKILNNRWVRIGVFIASFLVPFLPALQTVLDIFNTISDIVQTLQLTDMLLQHKYKEFGLSIAIGLASAAISVVADHVIKSVKAHLKGGFTLKGLFEGVWGGLKDGFADVFGRGWQSLIPVYGKYCAPGASRGGGINKGNPLGGIDALCQTHDIEYKSKLPEDLLRADKKLFRGLFTARSIVQIGDIVFAGRPSGGNVYRFVMIPAFGGLIVYREFK